MKIFWWVIAAVWLVLFILDLFNGNSTEFEAIMMFLSLILVNTSE